MATGQRLSIHCPHCAAVARVRSSRAVSPTFKQLNLQCENVECGATYGGVLEILHEIAPPAVRNLEIQLRSVPVRARALPVPANDGGPEVPPAIAANDDDGLAEAVAIGR
jgi:hypothetical protein